MNEGLSTKICSVAKTPLSYSRSRCFGQLTATFDLKCWCLGALSEKAAYPYTDGASNPQVNDLEAIMQNRQRNFLPGLSGTIGAGPSGAFQARRQGRQQSVEDEEVHHRRI